MVQMGIAMICSWGHIESFLAQEKLSWLPNDLQQWIRASQSSKSFHFYSFDMQRLNKLCGDLLTISPVYMFCRNVTTVTGNNLAGSSIAEYSYGEPTDDKKSDVLNEQYMCVAYSNNVSSD